MAKDAAAGERLKGKEFEQLVLDRLRKESMRGLGHWSRYGVQTSITSQAEPGDNSPEGRRPGNMVAMQSYPDIEGVLAPTGRQTIFDCKVESGSSFGLTNYMPTPGQKKAGSRQKQLKHLLDRASAGAICFFLIHWSHRVLVTKAFPAQTFAFPVHPAMGFWAEALMLRVKSITREDCELFGVKVEWDTGPRESTARPDVYEAMLLLAKRDPFIVRIPKQPPF